MGVHGSTPGIRGRTVGLAVTLALMAAACTHSTAPPDSSSSRASQQEPGPIAPSPLVEADQIVSGGVPPDGIPPIDDPTFVLATGAPKLAPQEPVIAVEINGVSKAYPVRIMTWHEVVNDEFAGAPVLVTYCPLCNTRIAFLRPRIEGEVLDFGTSGKLYDSNLVMYDRQTMSYWPQALGVAITGPLTGTKLTFAPARLLAWSDWRAANPQGLVLSANTGFARAYGTNPYVGYENARFPFLFNGDLDPRLPATEHVLGAPGIRPIAFSYSALSRRAAAGESSTNRRGTTWTIDGRGVSGPLAGSRLRAALAIDSFWFDWAAFHPDTTVYGAPDRLGRSPRVNRSTRHSIGRPGALDA